MAAWTADGEPAWPPSIACRALRTPERARVRTRALRNRRRLFCLTRFLADLVLANGSSPPSTTGGGERLFYFEVPFVSRSAETSPGAAQLGPARHSSNGG